MVHRIDDHLRGATPPVMITDDQLDTLRDFLQGLVAPANELTRQLLDGFSLEQRHHEEMMLHLDQLLRPGMELATRMLADYEANRQVPVSALLADQSPDAIERRRIEAEAAARRAAQDEPAVNAQRDAQAQRAQAEADAQAKRAADEQAQAQAREAWAKE